MNLIKYIIVLVVFGFSSLTYAQDTIIEEAPQDIELNDVEYLVPVTINKAMADSAYINNDFAGAAQLYEQLLLDGEAADVYYNLGNSYYKSDEIAKAILNYERALLLEPGNADIRFNLEMARARAIDKVDETPEIFFVTWVNSLINMHSVNSWAICGIVFFILLIGSLYFFIFSNKVLIKKIGFFSGICFLTMVILSNIFASHQKHRLIDRDNAVVVRPSVTVRSTPSDSGTSLFMLHEGRKVEVKDNSMREWKEIKLEDGKVGWVPASAIEII